MDSIATKELTQQDTEMELERAVTDISAYVGGIQISSDADYRNAGELGRMLQKKLSDVKAFFKPMLVAADRAHKEIKARENAMVQPLESAKKKLAFAMGTYEAEQRRKRLEAEQEARRAAQAEAERKLNEAALAEANGDSEAVEAALEEAVIMDDAAVTLTVTAEKPKAVGVSSKMDWEIVSVNSDEVPVNIAGIEIRPVDMATVMRLIRSSKGKMKIPGIVYREKVSVSFRR